MLLTSITRLAIEIYEFLTNYRRFLRNIWRPAWQSVHSIRPSPKISLTPANVITSDATNKSAMANEAKNRLPIRLKLRSV